MQSALALGRLLVENPEVSTRERISRLLRDYEREMVPRATDWVLASRHAGVDFQNTGQGLAGAEHKC
jgi:2-polyprenyl-6-methoxyphenol hydroxylase-like FAD-dependent oxidoreductase